MTTVGSPSRASILSNVRSRLAGSSAMDGSSGTLVRKLLSGQRLSAIEQQIAAATGLGTAVADLYVASQRAQGGAGGLVGIRDNANLVLKTHHVMAKASEADRIFAEQNRAYGKVSASYHGSKIAQAELATRSTRDKVVRLAGDVATVAGLGLSAVALPNMAKKAATSFSELTTLIHDPNATTDQRLNKVEELARSSAGTVFSAQGVYLGTKGVVTILSRSKTIGSALQSIGNSRVLSFLKFNPIGRALGALLPIADGAVFIGEVIATRRTFQDAKSTRSQKVRKVLDLSLASLKVGFWIFPQVTAIRSLYNLANMGQLALTVKDFSRDLRPKLIEAGRAIAWGVAHPIEATKAIGRGLKHFATGAYTKAGSAIVWLLDKLAHPAQTWQALSNEGKAWYDAYVLGTGQKLVEWVSPGAPAAPAVPAVPAAPAAPVASPEDIAFQEALAQVQAPLTPAAWPNG